MTWNRDTARDYGDVGRQHHVPIVRELIPELLGGLDGQRVLDFGCGPGRLTTALVEAGAEIVVAVDESPEMVDLARSKVAEFEVAVRDRIAVHHGDERDLAGLGRFDAAFSSLALMMSDTRERLQAIGRALVDSLRPGGQLLVVVTHPCFRGRDYGTFHYETPENYDYWSSGTPYEVVLTPEGGSAKAVITDYHWTLDDYCRAVVGNRSAVTGLRELPATRREDGSPEGPPAYLALLVEAVDRLRTADGR